MRARRILCALCAALAVALLLSPAAGAVRIGEAGLGAGTKPYDVAAGPDGNLFVSEQGANRVDKVRPDGGVIGQFGLGAGAAPAGIVTGQDGNLWVAEFGTRKIARVTPAGGVSHFPPGTTVGQPLGIAAGPDGNVWFTEFGAAFIGRIQPDGTLNQFASGGAALDIGAGPDGNLWFTVGDAIGRMTPAGVLLPEFSAGISPGAGPNSIALGADGNMWFTESAGIARITPAGTVTEFPLAPFDDPSARIAAGPDGNLWFTQFNDDRVGRITPDGTITIYAQGITANGSPSGIATGPDGRIWFTQYNGDRLGAVTLEPPTAVTGGATAIGPRSATVVATVNPLDYLTNVRFEYGPTTAYGSSTPPVTLAAGSSAVPVTAELTGLVPQSTIHFRAVAASLIGTTMGSDATLVTAAFPRVTARVRYAFALFSSFTRVTRLKLPRAPAGARIELRCKGRRKGCFEGVKRISVGAVAKPVDVRRRFLRRARLRPRAVLELRILVPDSIGKVMRFKIRRTKLPRSRVLCLPPGIRRPQRC
jgi:streptogramin lyase